MFFVYEILKSRIEMSFENLHDNDFPELFTNGTWFIKPDSQVEYHWRKTGVLLDSESEDVAMFIILPRLFIRLCLLFSLNNFLLMFCKFD